jgi:Ser/Thr protein kinase RdoA (MazF antagonist)
LRPSRPQAGAALSQGAGTETAACDHRERGARRTSGADGSWVTFDLDFVGVRERLYDIAASLHHVAPSGELFGPRRLLDAYESTAPEPLTRDEYRWLPGALTLVPLHWAATTGLVGDGIREAERAMTAAETWWSRRAELSA